jgi:hypothetical protein
MELVMMHKIMTSLVDQFTQKISTDMKLTARNSMFGCRLKENHIDIQTTEWLDQDAGVLSV